MKDMKNERSLDSIRKDINQIDSKMAELFVQRMRASEAVADYKRRHGMKILDSSRESEVIERNSSIKAS